MHIYKKSIVVKEDDLDDLNHVNNVRYVQWMQDISKEHWQTVAPEHIKKDLIWVVLTHKIDYKSAAVLGDRIEIKTYISKSQGVKSERVVEMINQANGALIVKSKTVWCLLNGKTQKPMRITKEIEDLFL